jgi:hypothetical protein
VAKASAASREVKTPIAFKRPSGVSRNAPAITSCPWACHSWARCVCAPIVAGASASAAPRDG